MKKVKLALIASAAVLCFACGGKTEADFSTVPIKGANGEYQYIDIPQKGKIVINPQFERAHLFRDGLALVKTSGTEGKWGYIDKKGKFAIAPVYSKAQDFSEGMAWVQMENQPPMLIDKKGKIILQIDSLTAAYPFNQGLAGVYVYSQGQSLTMFIDKKGNTVATMVQGEKIIPVMEDELYIFQNKENEKWGYKNKSGETVLNAQFDDIGFFLDGMTVTKNGNKWGTIDKKGNIIINPQYDSLAYDGNGLFLARVGKKWGWVNKKGEITINPQFDLSMGFRGNKLAPVQMGSKWGYIDKNGQIIINPQFSAAFPFSGDYAMVINTEEKAGSSRFANTEVKAGFIGKDGNFTVPPLYDIDENDILEYTLAAKQNLSGLPMQYFGEYMDKSLNYQNGDFYAYDRLKEKKEEWRERAIAAASGSLTDSRDNNTYKTIKIGNQIWMAQNLNYIGDGYLGLCYGDKPKEQIRKPENCDKYGRLYDWSEAMGMDREYNWKKLNDDENVQGVCPTGWHLPNREEWNTLMEAVGGDNVAGKKLRARSGWDNDNNGTDDYGFAALPGGELLNGYFKAIGTFGYWWSATESNASRTYTMNMDLSRDRLRWDNDDKSNLASVRCVKNHEPTAAEIAYAAEVKAAAKASASSFTDSRNGTQYKTVTIGKHAWMAENLNYETEGGKCYNGNPENCQKYGLLYNWAAAKKVCPSGWHLPSNEEWDALYRLIDGVSGTSSPYKSETAGKYLKATSGWNIFNGKPGDGEDAYGFAALPGGSNYAGKFNHIGNNGYWWSGSENEDDEAYYRFMLSESRIGGWNKGSKNLLLNVRCVRD
jgi:uncharacterized protein (TIGR02145 family)